MKILRILSYFLVVLLTVALIVGNLFYIQVRKYVDKSYSPAVLDDTETSRFKVEMNPDYTLSVYSDKSVYNKFEKIKLFARLEKKNSNKTLENAVVELEFYREGSLIKNLGGSEKIRLFYNKDQKVWSGYWYPENTDTTGVIDIRAAGYPDNPEGPVFAKTSIYVNEIAPKYSIRKGQAFIGIDSLERISKRNILSVDGKEVDWSYIPEWINFISADGILMLGGVTKTFQDDITLDSPWDNDKVNESFVLGDRLKQKGRSFGVWLKGLRVEGIYTKKMGYKSTLVFKGDKYTEENSLISLLDDNRKKSIIKLLTTFMDNDVVSYTGLSDIYLDQDQGVELFERFVQEFQMDLPDDWGKMDFDKRFQYFSGRMKDKKISDIFNSWKDYAISDYIRGIVEAAGHKKPMFYHLDYKTLLDNPNILSVVLNSGIDFAVIDFNVPYSEIKESMEKISALPKISRYFGRVIVSYYIDYKNVDMTEFDQSAIENYVQANMQIVKYGSEAMNANGIMINDFYKAMFGKRGPYSPYEWMLGIGEAIYQFKTMNQVLPLEISFSVPNQVIYGENFDAKIQILNTSPRAIGNLKIDFLPVMGSAQKSTIIPNVPEGKEIEITAPLQIETNNSQFMRKKSFVGMRFSWTDSQDDKAGSVKNGYILFKSLNIINQVQGPDTNAATNTTIVKPVKPAPLKAAAPGAMVK